MQEKRNNVCTVSCIVIEARLFGARELMLIKQIQGNYGGQWILCLAIAACLRVLQWTLEPSIDLSLRRFENVRLSTSDV